MARCTEQHTTCIADTIVSHAHCQLVYITASIVSWLYIVHLKDGDQIMY